MVDYICIWLPGGWPSQEPIRCQVTYLLRRGWLYIEKCISPLSKMQSCSWCRENDKSAHPPLPGPTEPILREWQRGQTLNPETLDRVREWQRGQGRTGRLLGDQIFSEGGHSFGILLPLAAGHGHAVQAVLLGRQLAGHLRLQAPQHEGAQQVLHPLRQPVDLLLSLHASPASPKVVSDLPRNYRLPSQWHAVCACVVGCADRHRTGGVTFLLAIRRKPKKKESEYVCTHCSCVSPQMGHP
jgi:hypothetical protein